MILIQRIYLLAFIKYTCDKIHTFIFIYYIYYIHFDILNFADYERNETCD